MLTALNTQSTERAGAKARVQSLSDQLVLALAAAGITDYFGVPGGAIEPLFNALARQQRANQVRFTATRSEAAAAFAADGYYRASGRLAVCTATTGPGTSNLITAAMSAHADRIPLLILTPQVALAKQGRGGLQDSSEDGYDLPRMLAACTRYSSSVTHPDQLQHKLSRALRVALTAPMGPVHLSIPSDVLAGRPSSAELRLACPEPGKTADAMGLERLLAALRAAAAPLFYVGDDAGKEALQLLSLAEALGVSVVSSPAGKRWLEHRHAAYAGVLGFSGHSEAKAAAAGADLVIAFGATFDEFSTNAWTALPEVPIFSVDRHSSHADRLANAVPIVADIGLAIDAIAANACPNSRVERVRRTEWPAQLVRGQQDGAVHPSDLMHWLSHALPDDVVVHVDAGNGFSWSTRDLVRKEADTYRVAMGLSTMCWAIGAAIGAAIASGRRTLCVTGDGSMLMSSLELTVAVEQRLPITYVILNDASLGMVRHGQILAGAEPIAHTLPLVRFDRLAQACGAAGMRIASTSELDRIPVSWLESDLDGPAVIDVWIDGSAVPPMIDRVRGLAGGAAR
jgi:acetolactate synthase-1/2/3 large subunit